MRARRVSVTASVVIAAEIGVTIPSVYTFDECSDRFVLDSIVKRPSERTDERFVIDVRVIETFHDRECIPVLGPYLKLIESVIVLTRRPVRYRLFLSLLRAFDSSLLLLITNAEIIRDAQNHGVRRIL